MTPPATQTDAHALLAGAIGPACHEMRSPLSVVYGFAKMLEHAELDEQSHTFVESIVSGSERLDAMMESLAQLGRVCAGRIAPSLTSVSIPALVDELTSPPTRGDDDDDAAPPVHGTLHVDGGASVDVLTDAEWLAPSLAAFADSLSLAEPVDAHIGWHAEGDDIVVEITGGDDESTIEHDPSRLGVSVALAQARVCAMGGSVDFTDDAIVVKLPRA